jgi:hypothetical protein
MKKVPFFSGDFVISSGRSKASVGRGRYAEFQETQFRTALYRPFCKQELFFNEMLVERRYQFPQIFPIPSAEQENRAIALTTLGSESPSFGIRRIAHASPSVVGRSPAATGSHRAACGRAGAPRGGRPPGECRDPRAEHQDQLPGRPESP